MENVLNITALLVGLVADLIAIIIAFESDKDNNFTIANYESHVVKIREEYLVNYGDSNNSEEIFKVLFLGGATLFGLSLGLYYYLFVGNYLFGIYSILLLLVVFQLRRFNYPVLSYVIQTSVYILILSRRFFTTSELKDFFNTFVSLNLSTTEGSTLGRNIRIIWDALFGKLGSEIIVDRMTAVVAIIIVLLFWIVVTLLLKNIIFPRRFKPQTLKSFIVYIAILLLLLNLNNPLIIDFVTSLLNSVWNFIKSFMEGFFNK